MEPRDDVRFDEIVGHLALIQYNFECYRKVFCFNRNNWSYILLIFEHIAYLKAFEKYNNTGDVFNFKCFPNFIKYNSVRDNGQAADHCMVE